MYGNLSVLDTLRNSNQTVLQFGEDNAFEIINELLTLHNEGMEELLSTFVEVTNERMFSFGTSDEMEMRRVDEFGARDTQKVTGGQNLGLPLYLHQIAIGWTKKAFQNMSTARLAAQFTAANDADVRNINREIRRALFTPTNNLTYTDRLVDRVKLELRALLNADGQEPGLGPNGEVFDGSTHTHYTASAALDATALTGLINNVREHGGSGDLVVFISRANEATVRGLTGFQPYVDSRIVQGANATYAEGDLDMVNIDNRAIGIFDAAEVWVKPWMFANYQVCMRIGDEKPLALRVRNGTLSAGPGALTIDAEHDHYPLRAQFMEREFGIGVRRRDRAAVHYSNGVTYVAPTIP
jgi:hypothetical protein